MKQLIEQYQTVIYKKPGHGQAAGQPAGAGVRNEVAHG
jgi:hypothetical protein